MIKKAPKSTNVCIESENAGQKEKKDFAVSSISANFAEFFLTIMECVA